jgi:hypothetical protein
MAICRPKTIGDAPARGPERSGGRRCGDFLVSRGMGEAQGKKVASTALRLRRSRRSRCSARSSHQRGHVRPRAEPQPWEKTWRMSVELHKSLVRFGAERETICKGRYRPGRTIDHGAPPPQLCGPAEIGRASLQALRGEVRSPLAQARCPLVQCGALCDLARPMMATKPHRSCVVAVRTGRDIFPTTLPASNGRSSANTVKRVHAVPPMQNAPPQAKASRQATEGTPICDRANTT